MPNYFPDKSNLFSSFIHRATFQKAYSWMAKKKDFKKDPMKQFAEKKTLQIKWDLKRDPKSGLRLLRDPGLPKKRPSW